jgi:penicillin amidase
LRPSSEIGRGGRSRAKIVVLVLVGFAAGLALGVGYGRERRAQRGAFPLVEGRVEVAGLGAPLEILRDARGVPHVMAQSEEDALFGMGFAHAQDRLGQMHWMLRLARGRTAEVLGEAGLPADRLARTLDLAGVAEAEAERLEPALRAALEAYARGVNARVERVRRGEESLPREMARHGLALEDWRPADTLAVLKFYAWSLSESLEASLVLDDLLGRLGGVGARRFFPAPPERGLPAGDAPAVTAARELDLEPGPGSARASAALWRDPLRRAAGLAGRSAGSSAFVLGGLHTASGAPLLAADAHLEPTAPSLLHLVHVRGGALDVAGSSVPGIPGVWTGHNRHVAWASTHAGAAVTDLYIEMLDPDGSPLYHDGTRWRPLEQRSETIEVRGRAPVTLTVRSTRHGPLLDELLEGERDPLAIGWVGLRGGGADTLAALLALARAADVDALLAALAGLSEPALAVAYAAPDGRAGVQVAGWIPRRPLSTELVPVPGRARWYDWAGRIPFDELPGVRLSDNRGYAVAADNVLGAAAGPAAGGWLWRSGARARRIESQLGRVVREGAVDLRGLAALQVDVAEPRGSELVAAALELAEEAGPLGREAGEVASLLARWDGESTPESVGAAAYHVFLVRLTDELFRSHLGEELLQRYLWLPHADPGQVVFEIVAEALAGGERGGWSDRERVGRAVRESLSDTWFRLSYELGASRQKWRWGRLHGIAFRPFAGVDSDPALGPFEAGGSGSTVNAAEYAPAEPFGVRIASTYRFAVDTGALDRSLTSLAPGVSEHPGHPHYDDGLSRWLEGAPALLVTGQLLVEEVSKTRQLLVPAP